MADPRIRITATDESSPAFRAAIANLQAMKTQSAGVVGALGALRITIAGLATGGLAIMAKNTIDGIDALNDLKDASGSTIENISALEDIAKRTGTSFEGVGTALIKFNSALKEAKPGSDVEAALASIGLKAKELKEIDPAEALLRTAQALSRFADDGNKARLVQELFGKSLKEVAPFLNDLAEKGKLNATVTAEQAKAAEDFNKQLFQMRKNSEDVARAIASDLLPTVNRLLENFNLIKQQGLLGTIIKDAAKDIIGLGKLTNDAGNDINRLMEERTAAQEKYNKTLSYEERFKGKNRDASNALKADIDDLNRLLAVARIRQASSVAINAADSGDALSRRTDKARPSVNFNGAAKGAGSKKSEEIDENRRQLAQYVEGLQRELEKNDELTASEKALNQLKTLGTLGQVPQVRELVLGIASQIDAEKELAEALKLKREAAIAAGDAVNKSNEEYQALLKRLLDATPSANLEKQRSDVQALTDEFQAGRIAEELYLEAVSARLDLISEKIEKTKSLAEDLGLTFVSAFEDAVVGGKQFSEILQGLEKDIIRIVTRKTVTEPLGNAVSSAFSGGGAGGGIGGGLESIFKSIFSFAGGGSTGGGTRTGGMDGQGGFLAMLHPRETVVDHTRGNTAGNSVTVVVNQSFGAGTSRATTMQAAADARRQLEMARRNL